MTLAPESSSARVRTPLPAPMSMTRSPRATPASTTRSAASRLLRRKCWPRATRVGRCRTATEDRRRRHARDCRRPTVCHSRTVFDHVTIRVSDRGASERFYETLLPEIGVSQTYSGEEFAEWNDFSLAQATSENAVTTRLHVGFAAPSRAHVDRFWQAGIDAGYRDDGA